MRNEDFDQFSAVINGVADLYSKPPLSEFAMSLWWNALKVYELIEVKRGLSRHVQNPDNGQFMPKPADVVRAIGGTTSDNATTAWSKVDKAVRTVGTYQDVAFDDPLIHAVLLDMGGWICVGSKSDSDWPFVQREFENRYRGYASRRIIPEYPPVLTGIASATNETNRHEFRAELQGYKNKPVLIGVAQKALSVISGGVECATGTKITRLAELADDAVKLLGNDSRQQADAA
jgi:hypothetical protein